MRTSIYITGYIIVAFMVFQSGFASGAIDWESGHIVELKNSGQTEGEIVAALDGYYGVFPHPTNFKQLAFYKFALDGGVAAGYPKTLYNEWGYYLPGICWDGRNFGLAYSTHTQARFSVISPSGQRVLGPLRLPGIPSGLSQRTSAFSVYWTGTGYAVFGLVGWLYAPTYYITHLYYWFVDTEGNIRIPGREICQVAPFTYSPQKDAEAATYDVAWNGANFFIAFRSGEVTDPPIQSLLIDINGNTVRGAAQGFVNAKPNVPRVAWSGATFALTGLQITTGPNPSNIPYIRFFDANGTPLTTEKAFGQYIIPNVIYPCVHWDGAKFIAAYQWTNPYTLIRYVGIDTFSAQGAMMGGHQHLDLTEGSVNAKFDWGVNLSIVGYGRNLMLQGQYSDGLSYWPMVLWLDGDYNGTIARPVWGPFPPFQLDVDKNVLSASGDTLQPVANIDRITTPFFPFVRIVTPDGTTLYLDSDGRLSPFPSQYVGSGPMVLPAPLENVPLRPLRFGRVPEGYYRLESGAVDALRTTSLDNIVYTNGGVAVQGLRIE